MMMKLSFPKLLSAICLSFLLGCQPGENSEVSDNRVSLVNGDELYSVHCSGCHGRNMEGGSATTLIKSDWMYGRRRGAMWKNVKYGISDGEMPAFEHLLSDDQVDSVVAFVVRSQTIPPNHVRTIPDQIETPEFTLEVENWVGAGLQTPWAIEFVNKNLALFSERDGDLHWVKNGVLDTTQIEGLPIPHTGSSTGGFMDVELDPQYNENGWIYLAYSHTDDDVKDKMANALTKVVRGKIQEGQWVEEQTLFEAPDSLRVVRGNRWGCRFLFDAEGRLYFTIGDMAQAMDSQDVGKATGKVFRINPDGTIPKDNPFIHRPNALPAVFTLGNRNTQGLALHPVTGEIWSTDHGPMGGDELNILKKGGNYGWPIVTYGRDYSGDTVSVLTEKEGMEPPVVQWTPSIAVDAATFCTSPLFPEWENKLLIGALALEELRLLSIDGTQVTNQELILKNIGRVRDVKFGPEGALYVVLNQPDLILRLRPKRVVG